MKNSPTTHLCPYNRTVRFAIIEVAAEQKILFSKRKSLDIQRKLWYCVELQKGDEGHVTKRNPDKRQRI